ncbi:MAG: hypothetical protein RL140_303 [Actinomycetota bacterium]|jgi:hypothetical protein
MKKSNQGISKLQGLALGQLGLIGLETVLGVIAATSFPNEGGNRIFNSLVTMLLIAFAIPAFMTIFSAAKLAKPKAKITPQEAKSAFGTQKALFIICILLLVPAIFLALNGFVFFALNCVLGIGIWPMVNKESKSFQHEV